MASKTTVIIISILVFVFISVIIFLIISSKSQSASGSGGGGCDSPDCKNKDLVCDVTNPSTLRSCSEDKDCIRCLGNYGCQITENTPVSLPQEKCLSPQYTWDIPSSTCYLSPNQRVCYPVDLDTSFACNQYTGNKVLSKKDINSPYEWKCLCKDNTAFTNNGELGSDCTSIKLCGMEGQTNKTSNRHLVLNGTADDSNPVYWDGSSGWNPFGPSYGGQGECVCLADDYADQQTLQCKPSRCSPGIAGSSDDQCSCPAGYVNCADITYRNDSIWGKYNLGLCAVGTCVPDPCKQNPDDLTSVYDPASHHCICAAPAIAVSSTEVPTGEKCVDVCYNNGPCGTGTDKRGDCYAVVDDSQDNKLIWQFRQGTCNLSNTSQCFQIYNTTSNLYLYTDDSSGLIYAKQEGSIYAMVPRCESQGSDVCVTINTGAVGIQTLIDNDSYYIFDIINKKYIGNDPNGNLAIATDPSTYIPFTYNSANNLTNNGTLAVSQNSFLTPKVDGNNTYTGQLTYRDRWKGTARCANCTPGHGQDSLGLCNEAACIPSNQYCNDDSQCCSKNCHTYLFSSYNHCD